MDLNWLSAMLVGAGCLTLGYCFGTRRPSFIFVRLTPKVVKCTKTNPSSHHGNKKNKSKEPFEIDKLADILDDFKMVMPFFSIWKIKYVLLLFLYMILFFNLFILFWCRFWLSETILRWEKGKLQLNAGCLLYSSGAVFVLAFIWNKEAISYFLFTKL